MLIAGGFSHIEVGPSTRLLAYECVLTYEVITKRLPVLDDLRNGLKSEQTMGLNLLDIALSHDKVKKLIFPEADSRIDLEDLIQLVRYDEADDDVKVSAKRCMEKYLQDLDVRGKLQVM